MRPAQLRKLLLENDGVRVRLFDSARGLELVIVHPGAKKASLFIIEHGIGSAGSARWALGVLKRAQKAKR